MNNIFKISSLLSICLLINVSFVFSDEASSRQQALLDAAHQGKTEVIEQFIQEKADLNIQDEEGNTLFHIAAEHGHDDIIELLAQYDKIPDGLWEKLRLLIFGSRGPDINRRNKYGDTPLHYALKNDELAGLITLVWNDADIDLCNKENYTPLLHAVKKGKKEHALYLMHVCNAYYTHTRNGANMLHVALENEDCDLAQEIIERNNAIVLSDREFGGNNALLKAKNHEGETPLFYCVKSYNYPVLKKILMTDATDISSIINEPNNKGYTPFAYVCHQKSNSEMEDLLLKYGSKLNKVTFSDAIPFHIVLNKCEYERATKLLRNGADINICDSLDGDTALHKAAYDNKAETIEWLLKNKADLHKRNKNNIDAMGKAIDKGNGDLLPLFIAYGGDVNVRDQEGKTRVMIELSRGNNSMVDRLIDLNANLTLFDKMGENALHKAARSYNKKGSESVLRKCKILINQANNYGNIPLHFVADNKKSSDLVVLYVQSGAGVNAQNNDGETSLHRAAAAGNLFSVEYLKKNNAFLNVFTTDNKSPAYYALAHDAFNCFFPLLDRGNVNVISSEGKTIFSLAIEKYLTKKSLQAIIDYGVDLTIRPNSKSGDTYLIHALKYDNNEAFELMMMIPFLIDERNHCLTSPLSCATQKNNKKAVHDLLQKKALKNIPDNFGWTELHHASKGSDYEMFVMLRDHGSRPEKRTDKGDTSLHVAARYNRMLVINDIQRNNSAIIDAENDKGEVAFQVALYNRNLEATQALFSEKYIVNGKAQVTLRDMPVSSFKSKAEIFLEQKINERNNEFNELLELQNKLTANVQKNIIMGKLLQQKTIKEHSVHAYHYEPSEMYLYTKKDLQESYQHQRNIHKTNVVNALKKEESYYQEMVSRQQKIDFENNQKELAQQKAEQEKLDAIALQQKEEIKPQGPESADEGDGLGYECNTCCEIKKDAQRRCINEKCDAKYCNDCKVLYLNGKTTTCLYCHIDLKK